MSAFSSRHLLAATAASIALHGAALWLLGLADAGPRQPTPAVASPQDQVVIVALEPPPPPDSAAVTVPVDPLPARSAQPTVEPPAPPGPAPDPSPPAPDAPAPVRAYKDAPPPPSAQEWALAAGYTLKNSKRYRYAWGQQVRSMMGTAVEGPDQGVVRFRIEIAPDGTLAALETLWSTSAVAERLARQAVERMPPLPPTPTGQPLVFEKTISFQPFDADIPPMYKDDCLPDPPAYRNPFAWDGRSPPPSAPAQAPRTPAPDTADLEACRRQLPQDSMEAEIANDQRQLDQWGSSRLGR